MYVCGACVFVCVLVCVLVCVRMTVCMRAYGSFIHYGELYSAPSRLLLRSAPDRCTAKEKSVDVIAFLHVFEITIQHSLLPLVLNVAYISNSTISLLFAPYIGLQ